MAELTNEQLLLMEIKDKLCDGNAAELARRIGRDATYVNRLFYPEGKDGRKGIGLRIMSACNEAFGLPVGFWEARYPALDDQTVNLVRARMLMHPGEKLAPLGRVGERLPTIGAAALTAQEPTVMFSRGKVREPAVGYPTLEPILAWNFEDELPPGEFVMVPRLDVHLSAGNGNGGTQVQIAFDENQPQAFRAEWIRQQHLKPNRLAAMCAAGDSMEPTIFDGDSLLIDTSQTEIIDKKVYALWYDGGERVKRLFRLPGGGLRIKSDNPEYDTIELGPDYRGQVRVIGRVVHRSGTGGL